MCSTNDAFDYVIVGAGLAGCTLASLLSKSPSSPSILLIEAGQDATSHPLTQAPLACFAAHRSDLDWNYHTVNQPHLNNRSLYNAGGKALGGGTVTNYGTWTRGPRRDYDRWGARVDDKRWSYDGLLPYFEKIDKEHITSVSTSQSHPDRHYPLRDRVLSAWLAQGLEKIGSGNEGDPIGVGEFTENFRNGQRQIASNAFDLSRVTVMAATMVNKVVLGKERGKLLAKGVELHDGRHILANKEVILSAGAYRTPQLLLLSGVGPAEDLKRLRIPVSLDLPGVGDNFHDHLMLCFAFRLRESSATAQVAGPWEEPAFQFGVPADWIVGDRVPDQILMKALARDEADGQHTDAEFLLGPRAHHVETFIAYVPVAFPGTPGHAPFDRTHIGAVVGALSPTSRGKITIASPSVTEPPIIDPNYNATEADRAMLRHGVRRLMHLVHDPLADVVESENPPPGCEPLTETSSDAAIDARVRAVGGTFCHGAGSASMGTVVDGDLRVKGVEGLRVVDASVLPVPISAHLQVAVYAIAAQAADIIAQAT
jgi:choline dehydrogenase-like flavoprotein